MDIRKRAGANIRRIRQQAGWSQEELGDKAGIDRTYVSGVERGVRNPSLTILERFAIALNVEAADLLAEPRQPR